MYIHNVCLGNSDHLKHNNNCKSFLNFPTITLTICSLINLPLIFFPFEFDSAFLNNIKYVFIQKEGTASCQTQGLV